MLPTSKASVLKNKWVSNLLETYFTYRIPIDDKLHSIAVKSNINLVNFKLILKFEKSPNMEKKMPWNGTIWTFSTFFVQNFQSVHPKSDAKTSYKWFDT